MHKWVNHFLEWDFGIRSLSIVPWSVSHDATFDANYPGVLNIHNIYLKFCIEF